MFDLYTILEMTWDLTDSRRFPDEPYVNKRMTI